MRFENLFQDGQKPVIAACMFASISLALTFFVSSCKTRETAAPVNSTPPTVDAPQAKSFSYPIGESETITEAKDSNDDWYNAQDFGENNHLGEDWNKNSGGDTDCGETVYAAASGTIIYAKHAGIGWGNVLIVEHVLPDGKKVQTLYGHLQDVLRDSGFVKKREKIGTVGNADGTYKCHLHFEIRNGKSRHWNEPGPGYSDKRDGWFDPSDFIDKHR